MIVCLDTSLSIRALCISGYVEINLFLGVKRILIRIYEIAGVGVLKTQANQEFCQVS